MTSDDLVVVVVVVVVCIRRAINRASVASSAVSEHDQIKPIRSVDLFASEKMEAEQQQQQQQKQQRTGHIISTIVNVAGLTSARNKISEYRRSTEGQPLVQPVGYWKAVGTGVGMKRHNGRDRLRTFGR